MSKKKTKLGRYLKRIKKRFLYDEQDIILDLTMRFIAEQKIDGDYLEFGVLKGKGFIRAFRFAKENNLNKMRFFAFDSFQGLPELKGIDAGTEEFKKGDLFCSLEDFQKNLLKNKIDLNRVKIVSGWFHETLTEETKKDLSIKKAAIIYIDCDLYESTVSVLNFITDYLTDGTIIIFDDWLAFEGSSYRGEQRAFSERLERNPNIKISEFYKLIPAKGLFIVHN